VQTVLNINKWNQVQEHLSQGNSGSTEQSVCKLSTIRTNFLLTSSQVATAVQVLPAHEASESSPGPEEEFEFSDVSALMCLLCARQFKALEQLKRHNKESDLHKV